MYQQPILIQMRKVHQSALRNPRNVSVSSDKSNPLASSVSNKQINPRSVSESKELK
jgi:hypothetical protein